MEILKHAWTIAGLCATVVVCGCTGGSREGAHVQLAIGGQNQMVYLPTTLAQELGYYKDEGLDVELQDFQGGAKALQALIGGSADVVSGFYDHTIQMAAEGRELVAFVTMLRFPGLVLTTSAQAADTVTRIEDLKGRIAGVTTAGSSSQMFLTFLLTRHQVPVESVSVTAIGSAATAIAAIEHGKIDAGWMADPSFTLIKRRNPGVRVLADLRTEEGVKAGVRHRNVPGVGVLCSNGSGARARRHRCAPRAGDRRGRCSWMHDHSAEEIAGKTPKALRGEDDRLYVESLKNSMAMFSR